MTCDWRVVDAHLHVWRAVPQHPNPGMTIVSPASDVPLELLEEYMREHDIEQAVLVQPQYPGEDNSYIADCAAAQPERFAAVCVVDPREPDAPERLDYWVSERGCKGLRLRPRMREEGEVFAQPRSFGLWEQARRRGVVINVLAGPEHVEAIGRMTDRFSDVPVLVDHMAHPDPAAGVDAPTFRSLLALARCPRVFIKVSGYYHFSRRPYPYADCHDLFRAVYDAFGPDRLIWGSDFPHVLLKAGYRRTLHLHERAFSFLSAGDLQKMMGGNARQLYWSATDNTPSHAV